MNKLEEKRVDWLYAHFQAISSASNHYLALLATIGAFSLVAFLSANEKFQVPALGLEASRDLVLSVSSLLGSFLFAAYCGAYDKGEATIQELCACLGCDYEALHIIDTQPNPIDLARFARQVSASRRNAFDRLVAAMLYPLIMLLVLAWFTFLALAELFQRPVTGLPLAVYICALLSLPLAWRRGLTYVGRRWRTYRTAERAIPPAADAQSR